MNANPLRVAGGLTLALVFGFLSQASAQVYSLNAVGYADVDYVAGSNLVANAFNAGDNTISNLFRDVPDGTIFLPGQGGASYSFGPANRFSTATGWTAPAATLVAPNGGFLWLPAATRVTFVGDVLWPQFMMQSGGYHWAVLDRFPERWPPMFCASFTDPCPQNAPPEGTQFHQWNHAQRYDVYTYLSLAPGFEPFAWYDKDYNVVNPRLAPGEAGLFWIPDPEPPRNWARGGAMPRADAVLSRVQYHGTNLSFQFTSSMSNRFAVLRSTNLASHRWEVIQSGTCTSAVAQVMVETTPMGGAFYRLQPPFGDYIVLMNPSRTGAVFRCEFYAPVSGTFSLLRKPELTAASWSAVASLVAASNTVVRVTDAAAVSATGYYIVRKE